MSDSNALLLALSILSSGVMISFSTLVAASGHWFFGMITLTVWSLMLAKILSKGVK